MINLCSFLNWLRDPFGSKRISKTHTDIRKRMVETKTRAEDTTEFVQRHPFVRNVRVNPVEKTMLGNRRIKRRRAVPVVKDSVS